MYLSSILEGSMQQGSCSDLKDPARIWRILKDPCKGLKDPCKILKDLQRGNRTLLSRSTKDPNADLQRFVKFNRVISLSPLFCCLLMFSFTKRLTLHITYTYCTHIHVLSYFVHFILPFPLSPFWASLNQPQYTSCSFDTEYWWYVLVFAVFLKGKPSLVLYSVCIQSLYQLKQLPQSRFW